MEGKSGQKKNFYENKQKRRISNKYVVNNTNARPDYHDNVLDDKSNNNKRFSLNSKQIKYIQRNGHLIYNIDINSNTQDDEIFNQEILTNNNIKISGNKMKYNNKTYVPKKVLPNQNNEHQIKKNATVNNPAQAKKDATNINNTPSKKEKPDLNNNGSGQIKKVNNQPDKTNYTYNAINKRQKETKTNVVPTKTANNTTPALHWKKENLKAINNGKDCPKKPTKQEELMALMKSNLTTNTEYIDPEVKFKEENPLLDLRNANELLKSGSVTYNILDESSKININ